MSPRSVVLVGPMGSGKSTVGRALARRLGTGHVDTDDLVTHRCGRSIPEIFEADGEDAFRSFESAALIEALAGTGVVVSTGGGIVTSAANRELLAGSPAFVVWLDGSIDALARRVGAGRGRPHLQGDVRESLQEKVRERTPGYLEVAELRLDTSDMRHDDCVEAIVAALEGVSA